MRLGSINENRLKIHDISSKIVNKKSGHGKSLKTEKRKHTE